MNVLHGLTFPLSIKEGEIVDGTGKPIILANRNSLETPLNPTGRDAILIVICFLLNEAFEYDKIDQILKKHYG
jgi:hypothetical protein